MLNNSMIIDIKHLRNKKNKSSIKTNVLYASNCLLTLNNVDINKEYCILINTLKSIKTNFKYLYTLSKYKKTLNPICCIYETLQVALFKVEKTMFDKWVIQLCIENKLKIVDALIFDCNLIKKFLVLDKSQIFKFTPELVKLLKKFTSYINFFNVIFMVDMYAL